MKHEYHEGPEAAAKFEKLATTMFRAPKPTAKPAAKPAGKRKVKRPTTVPRMK